MIIPSALLGRRAAFCRVFVDITLRVSLPTRLTFALMGPCLMVGRGLDSTDAAEPGCQDGGREEGAHEAEELIW